MKYNFDQPINRVQTSSTKWDGAEGVFGEKDLLPFWIADMDFQTSPAVIEALVERAAHGIFGYNKASASYYEAVIEWMKKRHQWEIDKEWLVFCPGVVVALSSIIQTFTEQGDAVIIQPPVYYPFKSMIVRNGRQVIYNELKIENGRYEMDFEDFKKKITPNVKILILCNPHNPGGRVWTKDELTELGRICIENNVLVVSDDIHHDLVYEGHSYTPFASISEQFADYSITCTAPSKTFNMAGLQMANIIVKNKQLRNALNLTLGRQALKAVNTFGLVATEVAYQQGGEWLEELLKYLQQNIEYLTAFIGKHIPTIHVMKPEATYLIWLDCRELDVDIRKLHHFLIQEEKVAFNLGNMYGVGGEGFIRINVACTRATLEEGLNRLYRGWLKFVHSSQE